MLPWYGNAVWLQCNLLCPNNGSHYNLNFEAILLFFFSCQHEIKMGMGTVLIGFSWKFIPCLAVCIPTSIFHARNSLDIVWLYLPIILIFSLYCYWFWFVFNLVQVCWRLDGSGRHCSSLVLFANIANLLTVLTWNQPSSSGRRCVWIFVRFIFTPD